MPGVPVSAHDTVHLALIRIMALASHDWALLFNLYFLLGFPLIALSALAVFRRFGVGTQRLRRACSTPSCRVACSSAKSTYS